MLKPFNTERPWGEFRQFTSGESVTVKLHFVKAGAEMSLQYHNKRSEFWRVISGTPVITIGDNTIEAKAGDEYTVDIGEQHRIASPNGESQILEIMEGEFDENDIVRIEDKYGR